MHTQVTLRISAIIFAIAYFASQFVPTLPEGAYSDDKVSSLLEGSGRTMIIVGGYLLATAAIAALVFTRALDHTLGGRSLAGVAGAVYATLLLIAAMCFVTIPLASAVGELPGEPAVESFRVMTQAGFVTLLIPALLVAMAAVISSSVEFRRSSTVPGWVPAVGFVVAPLLLLGFTWAPQFLFPIWAVTAAFGVSQSTHRQPSPNAGAPQPQG